MYHFSMEGIKKVIVSVKNSNHQLIIQKGKGIGNRGGAFPMALIYAGKIVSRNIQYAHSASQGISMRKFF